MTSRYPLFLDANQGSNGTASQGSSSTADNRPMYPSPSPLPSAYPPARGNAYPSAAHTNPLNANSSSSFPVQPTNPWASSSPSQADARPSPPAGKPQNMSSLTSYSVRIKDSFLLDPGIPPATLEPVHSSSHTLSTTLEDEILAAAEARRNRASSEFAITGSSAGASDSLLGDLNAINVSDSGGRVRDIPAQLPMMDTMATAVELYTSMNAGTEAAIRFALARYPAEDEEKVRAFCANFSKCKEVVSGTPDADIAKALYATDKETASWMHHAMEVAMNLRVSS